MRTVGPTHRKPHVVPTQWLLDRLSPEQGYEAEESWKRGGLARIPLGRRLDGIRVHDNTALRAVERLHRPMDEYHGVLYHQRLRMIEFLVPHRTAAHWSGGFPTVMARGRDTESGTVCPRPGAVAQQTFWIRPPGPHMVDPLHLAQVLTELGVPGIRYDPPQRYEPPPGR